MASLGGSLVEAGAAKAAAAAPASLFDDITAAGARIANRATNVTRGEFEANLLQSGFTKTVSKDGLTNIFLKDGMKYTTRATSNSFPGAPTAEVFVNGAKTLKIRLQP